MKAQHALGIDIGDHIYAYPDPRSPLKRE